MPFNQPSNLHTHEGDERRLGIELEMSGVSLDQLADLTARYISRYRAADSAVAVSEKGRYERVISGDLAGDWLAELDFALLKEMGRAEYADALADKMTQSVEELLAGLAEPLVPVELVSPPLPVSTLADFQALVDALRDQGARGTSDKLTNAFGMHLNIEVADTSADYIGSLLKAFFCLLDWLRQRLAVDPVRRITPYIDPFPVAYTRLVVNADYTPSRDRLIDDYLHHNPTRNRSLDMLPLFLHLDKKRVRAVTDDERIKPRPALHYRWPDCDIHRADWNVAAAWNDWLVVERLAANNELLEACCTAWQAFDQSTSQRLFGSWLAVLESDFLPVLLNREQDV